MNSDKRMKIKLPHKNGQQVKKQTKNIKLNHSQILDRMLSEVPEDVDFRKLANLEKNETLTTRHYIVYSIKKILQIADSLNWNICQHNGFIYLYNGCFWSRTEDNELKSFLGKAAKKMGWNESHSDYYISKDKLLKQFSSEAVLNKSSYKGDKVLINLLNGTFEISANSIGLRDFDKDDFLTYQLPFNYDPDAKAPKFKKFLDEVLPDQPLQNILSEFTGYVFIPSNFLKLEKVLMLYGTGDNGKSVFFDILSALLGEVNLSTYSLQSLTNDNGYYRVDIADKLVNYASEIDGRIGTSHFKQLASGEPIEARLPYKDPIIIRNYAKLIFNINQLPNDVEHTDAFFRRFQIIPFDIKISEEKRDAKLAKKIIKNDLPGVFNWALSGLNRLLAKKKFTYSSKSEKLLQSYRRESDSVAMFLDDNKYKKSIDNYTPQINLYKEYRSYCNENGYVFLSNIKFGRRIESLGYVRGEKSTGRIIYIEKKSL